MLKRKNNRISKTATKERNCTEVSSKIDLEAYDENNTVEEKVNKLGLSFRQKFQDQVDIIELSKWKIGNYEKQRNLPNKLRLMQQNVTV